MISFDELKERTVKTYIDSKYIILTEELFYDIFSKPTLPEYNNNPIITAQELIDLHRELWAALRLEYDS
jgi:hypothetical protein